VKGKAAFPSSADQFQHVSSGLFEVLFCKRINSCQASLDLIPCVVFFLSIFMKRRERPRGRRASLRARSRAGLRPLLRPTPLALRLWKGARGVGMC